MKYTLANPKEDSTAMKKRYEQYTLPRLPRDARPFKLGSSILGTCRGVGGGRDAVAANSRMMMAEALRGA